MEVAAKSKSRPKAEEHFRLSRTAPFHFYSGAISSEEDRSKLATPVRWSMHYELEIAICLEGRVRFFFGEESGEYGPGDVWLVGSWEPHNRDILSSSYEVTGLVFLPEVLMNDLPAEAPEIDWVWPFQAPVVERPAATETQRQDIIDLGRRMKRYGMDGGPLQQVRMRGLLFEMLSLMLAPYVQAAEEDQTRYRASQRLRPAFDLVNSRQDRVTVDEAASACALSRSSFTTLFRRRMGVGFAEFDLRRRLGCAAEAIDRGDQPLKAVARQWGFSNESHLTRVFRRYYDCTPGDYRNDHKQL